MDIEYDRRKSDVTKSVRGFDFEYAARIFEGRTIMYIDTRRDYGEVRMIAIGEIEHKLFKVVLHGSRQRPADHFRQSCQPTGEAVMAVVRLTPEEVAARGTIDHDRVDALTEEDIARFNADDGFDPEDTLKGLRRVFSPAEIRERVGLTQAEIAARLAIPVTIWRAWEQGRAALDPVARGFLDLVADDPERAFRVRKSPSKSKQTAG